MTNQIIQSAVKYLNRSRGLAEKTFAQLDESEFHFIPAPESNSIAINIQHLAGNMKSRFTDFLTTDGEKPWRERDQEFVDQNLTKAELLKSWNEGWEIADAALGALKDEDLSRVVKIRGEDHTVSEAIHRHLGHVAYHVGQIVFLGKLVKTQSWKNISIPRGQSEEFHAAMLGKK